MSEHSGPGLPNYLRGLVIAPDGASGWVPSKQDNVLAGRARSGVDLTHDHTVRAISSKVDLAALSADVANRVDHDNASIARSAAYGAFGNYLYVALEGNRMIAVLDAYRGEELFRFAAGRAPAGIAAAADGRRLFVHNYMDRTVTAHDLGPLVDQAQNSVGLLGSIDTVSSEALTANVLQGKRLFNDALDPRLTLESYMSCASCHADGDDDGRVWDFTQFGEGHRNTISLVGHGQHGPVHWTGNFDEIQDFEAQIRSFARGLGLMSDADFNTGTRSNPLGDPKAGISADLDALAAYVESLTDVPPSTHRPAAGLSSAAENGRALFESSDCQSCHTPPTFTDSALGLLHDIGTGGSFDTPTLLDVAATPPYLHDGSAPTLAAAINAHSSVTLSGAEADDVAQFLREMAPGDLNTGGLDPAALSPLHYWSADQTLETGAGGDNSLQNLGGVGFAPGKSGDAFVFDGIDDRLVSNQALALTGNVPWTVAMWIKPGPNPQVSGYGGVLAEWGSRGNTSAPYFNYNGTRSRFEYGFWGWEGATAGDYPFGVWMHLVSSYDGDRWRLYVDGSVVVDLDIGPMTLTPTPLGLGWDVVSNTTRWNYDGLMDEVYVFDRSLTQAEVDQLAAGTPPPPPPPNQTPSLQDPGPQSNTSGDVVTLTLTASDPDGDTLSYSAVGLPSGLSLDSATGNISGAIQEGTYSVVASVDDGRGGSDSQSFSWIATPAPDSDGDGVPDDEDAFPNDPNETVDSDGDGVGDNGDAFPNDPNESTDTDGDGVGDNADAFPNDPNETADSDGDGVGDNADDFPNDPNETQDSDGDGVGDNSDYYPNDPTRWQPPIPNALHYWSLDGSLAATAGVDNTLITSGGSGFAAGRRGQALQLDGIDDRTTTDLTVPFTGNDAWSVSLWIKPGANAQWGGYGRVLFTFGRRGSNTAPFVNYNGTMDRFEYGFWGLENSTASVFPNDDPNTWYHVTGTYDGASFRLYVDGSLVVTQPITLNLLPPNIGFGWDSVSRNNNWNFEGLIDEVYVFDSALSAAQVQHVRDLAP